MFYCLGNAGLIGWYLAMEINVYRENIDPLLWNDILSKVGTDIHNIYQSYEWAILMKKCYGLSPHFVIASDNECPCGGQLYFRKPILKLFNAYETCGGPLCVNDNQFSCLRLDLIKHLIGLEHFPAYISIRPRLNDSDQFYYEQNGFLKSPFYTFILDLQQGEASIWKSFQKNARNGIRKAEKTNIEIREAKSWNKWSDFYKLHDKHSRKRRIAPKSLEFFKTIYNSFLPKGLARLFIAAKDNSLIGGMLFLSSSGVMNYYIGASDDMYKEHSANDLLMWEAIKWGISNEYRTIDLGDTWPNPQSHLYSIHKFKEKWGGQLVDRSFYIKGLVYRIGRSLVLNNNLAQNAYEFIHERNIF